MRAVSFVLLSGGCGSLRCTSAIGDGRISASPSDALIGVGGTVVRHVVVEGGLANAYGNAVAASIAATAVAASIAATVASIGYRRVTPPCAVRWGV
jgi:cation transporter-like permease